LTPICTNSFVGWGFDPDPTGGAYSAPLDLLAVFMGPTCKRKGEKERGDKKREGEGKGERREGEGKEGKETGGRNVCVAAPPIRSAIDILMVTAMALMWTVTNSTQ